MKKREVKTIADLLPQFLREEGLETPLLQKRLLDSWDSIVGPTISRYTGNKYISDQVLHVKILNPALRQDLSMMRSQLLTRLNKSVGASVIVDVRIY
ncbi:MAG: DciA family protein [Prevotella sp.]|jgi:predicted nucleic acid-binding Zn ribbon protein